MSLVRFNGSNIKTGFIKNLLEHSYVPSVNTISNFERSVKTLLPKEYQQVEYIESTGTQYIDTGLQGKSGYTLETEIAFSKINYSNYQCWGFVSSSNSILFIRQGTETYQKDFLGYAYSWGPEDASTIIKINDNVFYKIISKMRKGNQIFIAKNESFSSARQNDISSSLNIYMFASSYSGAGGTAYYCYNKCKYARWYNESGALIRNFIPCYHKLYGTIGLYDTVFQKFYTNQGTGTFLKGADVNIVEEIDNYSTPIQLNADYFYKDSIINIDSYKIEHPTTFPNDYNISTISKINYDINTHIPQYTRYFKNRYNYYDSETHAYLGDYLRTLRDVYNLDLMPLYNVFNEQYITDIELKLDDSYKVVFNEQDTDTYKVYAVPIKYNKPYTISLQCASNVLISPILYDNRALVKNILETQEDKYYTEFLKYDSSINVGGMTFNKPYVFQGVSSEMSDEGISIFGDANFLYNQERNLYLLIQVPKNNKSSLVVIEGQYNFGSCEKVVNLGDVKEKTDLSDYYVNTTYISKPDLLSVNDVNNYAFSDRLIEYLTLNTIDNNDKIEFNVLNVQRKLGLSETTIWNDEMRVNLYNRLLSLDEDKRRQINIDNKDILGYVDKDIERYLNSILFNLNFDDPTKTDE